MTETVPRSYKCTEAGAPGDWQSNQNRSADEPNALPANLAPPTAATCGYCLGPFTRRRSWQLYCSTACRNEAAARKVSTGMRGIVSSVRVMKRGSVSVVLRFGLEERERVLKLEPGKVVGVDVAT